MTILQESYLIPEDKTSEHIILVLTLFLIIGVWIIIFFFVAKNPDNNSFTAFEVCETGDCATNRLSGEKRCPAVANQTIQYDPIFEVCNPPKGCTANTTPYALLSDGSTSFSGNCDVTGCRCVNYLSAPDYVEVIFNMQGGLLQNGNLNTENRLTLTQQPSPFVGEGNGVPIIYTDYTTQAWSIAPSDLIYVMPSPCGPLFYDGGDVSDESFLKCINQNPCVMGKMAYVPPNVESYVSFNLDKVKGGTPLACVVNTVANPPTQDVDLSNTCLTTGTNKYYAYAPVFNLIDGKIHCIPTGLI